MSDELHILLSKSRPYPRHNGALAPPGTRYDAILGAWVLEADPSRLAVHSPEHRPPRTKKEDLETGEDQKGT